MFNSIIKELINLSNLFKEMDLLDLKRSNNRKKHKNVKKRNNKKKGKKKKKK